MRNDIHRLGLTIGEKRLAKLISAVKKEIDGCPAADAFCTEELEELKKQTEYMGMYAYSDNKDPYRQQVFDNIVNSLIRLKLDVVKCTKVELSSDFKYMKKRAKEEHFELPEIRHKIEDYVSSVAAAEVTGDDDEKIIEEHFNYIEKLFDYIVTGRLWNETTKRFFSELVSSPVIDSNDAQIIVSAITVSTLFVSDEYKLEALIEIYSSSKVPEVKERALVGWVLALHSVGGMCERLDERIKALISDNKVIEELLELQMQIIYCAEAEKDTDTIQRDIMPGIVNNSGFNLNRFGMIDQDYDEMNDILGEGDTDKEFEDIERKMDQIKEMRKNGADIYFAGFSQMKNFSFFSTMINWFSPYFCKHPGIKSAAELISNKKILESIVEDCPFCNSDKYSFALAMSTIYQRLPNEIREMMDSEEMFKMDNGEFDYSSPSYIRRMYLQDLYRFYKLNPTAKYIDNPFSESNGLLRGFFFDDEFLLGDVMVQAKKSLARFFVKKRPESEELNLLFDSYATEDPDDMMLRAGHLAQSGDNVNLNAALSIYRKLYKAHNDNDTVLRGLVRCLSRLGQNEEACTFSEKLIEKHPEESKSLLSHAIILIKCKKETEAGKILFKLNYEHPEDRNVMRVLSWCLLMEGKKEKAFDMLEKVMNSGKINASDNLNAGFIKWVSGKDFEAADYFAKYVKIENLHKLTHEIDDERFFLNNHGIMEVDMCMMLDLVEQRTKNE